MRMCATMERGVISFVLIVLLIPCPTIALGLDSGNWTRVDSIVATIDGSPVLETDILMEADLGLLESPRHDNDFNGLLEVYLNRLLILKEVEEVGGFRLTEGQAEGAYRGYLLRYKTREDYVSKLRSWGIDETQVREKLDRALLASLYTESHIQFYVNILPSDIEKAYTENPERWSGINIYEAWETIKSELRQTTYQKEKERWLNTLRERYDLVVFGRNGE